MEPTPLARSRVPARLIWPLARQMEYCCEDMKEQLLRTCDVHADLSNCPDALVVHVEDPGEFGIRVHDGGSSFVSIRHCPWCGAALSPQHGGDLHAGDYQIRHLQNLIRLVGMLRSLPARLEDHEYSYTSFGSWWANVRFRGILFRIVFDGRDRELVIERSITDRQPYAWSSPEWRRTVGAHSEMPSAEIAQALRSAAG
jgi:hypothetical protein